MQNKLRQSWGVRKIQPGNVPEYLFANGYFIMNLFSGAEFNGSVTGFVLLRLTTVGGRWSI